MTIIINGKAIEIPVASLPAGDVGVYSVTQAEYDAIPESDRTGNLYIITDAEGGNGGNGSSSGSSMEIYDGEERIIGTWFGKPLYERVFSFVSPSSYSSTSSSVVKTLDDNISPVTVESYLKFDDFTINPLPFFASTTEYVVLFIEANNVYMRVSSKAYVSTNGYMVIKYTKTTD